MIKLFVGGKGSGKTKTLIDLVNTAANESSGAVVCIEKGNKLQLDITYKARLIDADAFGINGASELFGFIAGILASNSDITDLFVDAALKICGDDKDAFASTLKRVNAISGDVRIVMTASIPAEECNDDIKAFI